MKSPRFSVRALLLGAVVSVSTLVASPEPVAWSSESRLAEEARAMKVSGAQTIAVVPLSLGTPATPFLLHSWKIERSSAEGASKLFCLDLFQSDPDNQGKWRIVSSTSYVGKGSVYPHPGTVEFETRWLHPATKRGLVIVEKTPESTAILYRLITLPDWVGNKPGASRETRYSVKEFYSDFGGPSTSSIGFGVDRRGWLTVEEVYAPHAPVAATKSTYSWNGAGWAKVASKPVK